MTSFELANVLSIFQRYINWVLQNFLNKFCSVYVNDILIFTDELLHQHRNHIWKILLWLQEVDLQIDIDKCEFEVKSIKYLKFILKVRKGVQMNSQKMKAIMNWQAPKSVKNVQSFIGFANFYHNNSFDQKCCRMSVHSVEIVTSVIQTIAEKITDRAS